MKEYFSVDEILKMAELLERNGAAFYRLAMERTSSQHIRKVLQDLASWEEEHEQIFACMRAILTEKAPDRKALDPKDKKSMHLRAMVDGHVFDLQANPTDLLKGRESIEDVLQMALGREKDSIIFYLNLKDLVVETADRKSIDRIIEEEMNHIALLNRELTTLRDQPM